MYEFYTYYTYTSTSLVRRFGARYYDSDASIWLSVDPMADQRSWVSPYNYCQNNPVMRGDPTGALDDNYSIDKKTGTIMLEQKTNDSFDMLYAKADWDAGNIDNGVRVNDRSVLPSLTASSVKTQTTIGTSDNANDLLNVFKFCADNSDVEWAFSRYKMGSKNRYATWTNHERSWVNTASSVGISNEIAHMHSHPGTLPNYMDEMGSMGAEWYEKGQYFYPLKHNPIGGATPDWQRVKERNGSPIEYVYMKNSGNIYNLRQQKPAFIRTVNSYKDFNFGVLNHK